MYSCDTVFSTVLIIVSGTYGLVEVVKNATTISPIVTDGDNESGNDTFIDCTVALQTNITDEMGSKTYTNFDEIPAKEIIIVVLMLGLWFYSILLTRKAWVKILRE